MSPEQPKTILGGRKLTCLESIGILVLLFGGCAALVVIISANKDAATSTSTAAAATPAAVPPSMGEPQRAPAPEKAASIGDTVTLSDSTWSVLIAKDLGPIVKSDNQFVEDLKSEGAKYVAVAFKVTNLGSKEERIWGHPKVRDRLGREFDVHDRTAFFLPKGKKTMQLEAVPAGLPKEFWAIYEVPATATGLQFLARELGMRARTYPINLGL